MPRTPSDNASTTQPATPAGYTKDTPVRPLDTGRSRESAPPKPLVAQNQLNRRHRRTLRGQRPERGCPLDRPPDRCAEPIRCACSREQEGRQRTNECATTRGRGHCLSWAHVIQPAPPGRKLDRLSESPRLANGGCSAQPHAPLNPMRRKRGIPHQGNGNGSHQARGRVVGRLRTTARRCACGTTTVGVASGSPSSGSRGR